MAQFLPSQIFENIPKYNGRDLCTDWLTNFNERCEHFEYNEFWRLNNMEKFLIDSAKHWWRFSKSNYIDGLTRNNSHARYVAFTTAIKAGFPKPNDKKIATDENVKLKFTPITDHPRDYVYKKRELFHRMDPNMTVASQLDYLYDGLPIELRRSVRCQLGADGTLEQFLKELTCFAEELEKESKSDTTTDACAELYKFNDSNNVSQPLLPTTEPQSQERTAQFLNSFPPGFTNHSPLICGYCGKIGHLLMACDLHRQDFMPRYNQSGSYKNNQRDQPFNHSNKPHYEKPYDRNNSRQNNRFHHNNNGGKGENDFKRNFGSDSNNKQGNDQA